jgi:hypothetical protein
MSPAGMEPLTSERHGQSPQGRSAGALRSIEPSCGPITKLPTICKCATFLSKSQGPKFQKIGQLGRAPTKGVGQPVKAVGSANRQTIPRSN